MTDLFYETLSPSAFQCECILNCFDTIINRAFTYLIIHLYQYNMRTQELVCLLYFTIHNRFIHPSAIHILLLI